MEIYKQDYFKIFQTNFEYELVDTPLGLAVKMPPRDAFIYSAVTGSGYLENPVYPFTPKGLLKLFYNAFDYKFVTGIFDNGVIKNSPLILSAGKPHLFEGDKYIVPIEFDTEKEISTFLNEQFDKLEDPQNYIVQRIETSKKGNGMEPFMEYLTAEYFKNKGFIVENQVPLAHSLGSPDFAGYGLSSIVKSINDYGFLSAAGFHIIELSMIRIFKETKTNQSFIKNDEIVVGEAKTGTSVMTKQLNKYLETGLFDVGYEIHPSKLNPSSEYVGLVSLDDNFCLKVTPPMVEKVFDEKFSKDDYRVWLEMYIKFYLISNFSNDELGEFSLSKSGIKINTESDLVAFLNSLSVEEILDEINKM